MRVTRSARRGVVALLAVFSLLAAACGTASAGTSGTAPLVHVTLALDYTPNTDHTGLFVAQQLGYYRQQGIAVDFIPAGATYPEALVGTGQANFGISFQEYTAVAIAQGQPLVSLATVIQHNTSAMAVLASSDITRPAQLVGKRLASFGDPAEQAVIDVMEVSDGATQPGYQTVTFSNPDVKNLQTGSADFIWIYLGVEGVQAKDAGIQLRTFLPQDYGVPDFYSPIIITNQTEIAQHPDIVRKFMTATAQGYTYAAQHPQASADMLLAGAKAQGGTLFDTNQVAYDSQAFQSAAYIADAKCWGVQSLTVWTDFTRFLFRNGVLTDANNKPLTTEPNYAAMFTNQFLPACP